MKSSIKQLIIQPGDRDLILRFLRMLDDQQRAVHAVRTHGAGASGRLAA